MQLKELKEAIKLKSGGASTYKTLDDDYSFAPNQVVMFRISDISGSSSIYTPAVVKAVAFTEWLPECDILFWNRWDNAIGTVGGSSEISRVILHRYVEDSGIPNTAFEFLDLMSKGDKEDKAWFNSMFSVFERDKKYYKIMLSEIKETMKTEKLKYYASIDYIVENVGKDK